MPDWKSIAAARELGIPDQEIDRVAGPLDALEAAFRPLTRDLPSSLEPATLYRADEEQA